MTVTERVPTGVHLSAGERGLPRDQGARGAHTLDLPFAYPSASSGGNLS